MKRVLFLGSKKLGYKVLEILNNRIKNNLIGCITIDDCSDTRSELKQITDYCCKNGIVYDVTKIYENPAEYIKKYAPDLCIVVGWYSMIPQDIINSVEDGFIGVHNSLLPSYRGQAPLVWAMINDEKKVGFSVFSLDRGTDTGDIWYQGEVEVAESDHIKDVLEKIEAGVISYFDNEIEKIVSGDVKPHKQCMVNISYGAKRNEYDGRIDWSWNARKIYNFVRAQSRPYPGAYAEYKGKIYKIWDCEIFEHCVYGMPGQILLINKDFGYVVIVCGDNTAVIVKSLFDGKDLVASTIITNMSAKME